MSSLDRIVNIQQDVRDNDERTVLGKTSIAKIVLIYYLFAMQGYCKDLIGKPLKRFIEDNRIFQHFIGFLVIFVLLSWESDFSGTGPTLTVGDALIYSIIGYTWVVFSSKLDAHWNIILLSVLLYIFILDNHFRRTENDIRNDSNLMDGQKIKIIENNNLYRTWLTAGAILITITGTLLYSNRKEEQYGGSYDVLTYLLY